MIVEVNGRPMQDMTLLDAYQVFRNLSPGPVDIVIKRGDNLQVSHQLIYIQQTFSSIFAVYLLVLSFKSFNMHYYTTKQGS